MNIEDILKEWDEDSKLDENKLDLIALGIPQMHSKYIRMLTNERLLLKKFEADYKTLKLDKQEFYIDGPTEEQIAKGWELPAKGRILKSDAGPYIDADKDIIKLSLKIGLQQEKIDVLKTIIDCISKIGFQIRAAIDWQRFMNGS